MNNLKRATLAAAAVFAVLGSAARERSSPFSGRSSSASQSRTRESGLTARGTSQPASTRSSFGQRAPASRSSAAPVAPRVQSAPSRVSVPQPSVTRAARFHPD